MSGAKQDVLKAVSLVVSLTLALLGCRCAQTIKVACFFSTTIRMDNHCRKVGHFVGVVAVCPDISLKSDYEAEKMEFIAMNVLYCRVIFVCTEGRTVARCHGLLGSTRRSYLRWCG